MCEQGSTDFASKLTALGSICILRPYVEAAPWPTCLFPEHVSCAGTELTCIPYGGNFTVGDGGGEAAADARRALASNAGLRKQRTARARLRMALEAVRRSFVAARGTVRRVRRVRKKDDDEDEGRGVSRSINQDGQGHSQEGALSGKSGKSAEGST